MTPLEETLRQSFLASLKPAWSSDTLDTRGDCDMHARDRNGYRYIGTYRDHYADGSSSVVTIHKILR